LTQPSAFNSGYFRTSENIHKIENWTYYGKFDQKKKASGFGVLKSGPQKIVYKGFFKDGVEQGVGIQYPCWGNSVFYEGEFEEGKKSGYGKIYSNPKDRPKIASDANKLEKNEIIGKLDLKRQGKFKNDISYGCGILYKKNGLMVKGSWIKSVLQRGRCWILSRQGLNKIEVTVFKGVVTNPNSRRAYGELYDWDTGNGTKVVYEGWFDVGRVAMTGFGCVVDVYGGRKYGMFVENVMVRGYGEGEGAEVKKQIFRAAKTGFKSW
jgi:hypothetical protein